MTVVAIDKIIPYIPYIAEHLSIYKALPHTISCVIVLRTQGEC